MSNDTALNKTRTTSKNSKSEIQIANSLSILGLASWSDLEAGILIMGFKCYKISINNITPLLHLWLTF